MPCVCVCVGFSVSPFPLDPLSTAGLVWLVEATPLGLCAQRALFWTFAWLVSSTLYSEWACVCRVCVYERALRLRVNFESLVCARVPDHVCCRERLLVSAQGLCVYVEAQRVWLCKHLCSCFPARANGRVPVVWVAIVE